MINGTFLAVIALILWGISDFFASLSSKNIKSINTFFWMQVAGIIPLSIIAFSIGFPVFSKTSVIILLLSGLLILIGTLGFYKALEVGKVSILSPISSTWPIITVALSIIFLNEILSTIQAIGIILTIIGTIFVSFKYHELLKVKKISKGVNYVLVSILCWGLVFTILPIAVKELGWFFPIFIIKTTTLMFLIPVILFRKTSITFKGYKNWISVSIVGIFAGSAFLTYGFAINNTYTSLIAPIAASSPAVTILLAHIFSKERLEINQYLGILLILGGIIIISL